MADLNELSAQEIGRRLRIARESAGIRQDDAAQVIGMSRPTLVSIEKGVRRVRIQEIQTLARHYGVSVNALLRREAVYTDLMLRFRKLRETEDTHVTETIQLFNDLIKADVELENVLGIHRRQIYPPERGINEGDVVALAEKHAKELRDWLGLGPGPIADIFTVIELGLGIRLYQRRLSAGSKVAGLFTYDESVGACILLNANHPLPRRIQSAAHEVGHFYGTRQIPEVLEEDEKFLSRDERYANAFGRAFLTPAESFSESFRQLKEITGKTTRRLIILLAQQYNISRQACGLRLEELGLAKKGTWAWFENNGGITDEHAREVLGEMTDRRDPAKSDADRPISHRLSLMAHAAWKRELMSEGQLAELLKVSRLELRGIVDQIELEERETDELLKLLIDIAGPLVLDTSVLINLHACKYGEQILAAIPNDIVVPETVAGELEHETSRRNGEYSFLNRVVANGSVTLANLTDAEYEIFYELTSASPSLDDGEAATIAICVAQHFMPVIDERKGRSRASTLMKARAPGWSLDLFRHPTAVAALGDQLAVEALYLALRDGRMRIPSETADGVIALIGEERSRNCTCLPGYRERFGGKRDNLAVLKPAGVENLSTRE